jgi:hypothetical protein
MKKFFIALVLMSSLIGAYWVITSLINNANDEVEVTPTEKSNEAAKNVAVAEPTPVGTVASGSGSGSGEDANPDQEKALPQADKERYQAYFLETEKAWESRMEDFFLRETDLGKPKLDTYQRMREGYERDKIEAFQQHHEFMKAQYGDNYTYKPSEDEQGFARDVIKRYEEALAKEIGAEHAQKLREIRQQFNEQLKKDSDKELGHMSLEF